MPTIKVRLRSENPGFPNIIVNVESLSKVADLKRVVSLRFPMSPDIATVTLTHGDRVLSDSEEVHRFQSDVDIPTFMVLINSSQGILAENQFQDETTSSASHDTPSEVRQTQVDAPGLRQRVSTQASPSVQGAFQGVPNPLQWQQYELQYSQHWEQCRNIMGLYYGTHCDPRLSAAYQMWLASGGIVAPPMGYMPTPYSMPQTAGGLAQVPQTAEGVAQVPQAAGGAAQGPQDDVQQQQGAFAAGGILVDDEENDNRGNPDMMDTLASVLRWVFVYSLFFYYSTPSRFVLVVAITLLVFLVKKGFLVLPQGPEPAVQGPAGNQAVEGFPDGDQNQREQPGAQAPGPSGIHNDSGSQDRSADTAILTPEPPSRWSVLGSFVVTFFTSLIPVQPQRVLE